MCIRDRYGGDLPDALLVDPTHSRTQSPSPGAILMRFADHPWGPFSEPEPHLLPGDPAREGSGYGPGGFLFHHACADSAEAACARTDPVRPFESYLPGCPSLDPQLDVGRLYGVNIIDAYTRRIGTDRAEIFFNVSTWNPYGVVLVRTELSLEQTQ